MKQGYKRSLLFIAFILVFQPGWSQDSTRSDAHAKATSPMRIMPAQRLLKEKVRFEIGAGTGSRGVSQYFLNRAIFGGYVSPENMDKSIKLLSDNFNAVGLNTTLGIRVNDCFKRNKKVVADGVMIDRNPWGIALEQKMLMGSSFSRDFFKLIFKGNLPYEGQTLDLKKMKVNVISYSALTLVLNERITSKNKRTDLRISGASLLYGMGYANIYAHNSKLYTAPWGDSVSGEINGNWDAKRNGGIGFSTGFTVQNSNFTGWSMAIKDLGIMYIPNIKRYSKEGAFSMHQQPLVRMDFIGNQFSNKIKDTIKRSLKLDSSSFDKTVLIPFTISIAKRFEKGSMVKLNYLYLPGYLPELSYYSKFYLLYRASKNNFRIHAQPSLALGGFDTYNLNLDAAIWFRKVMAYLEFKGLEGFVLSKQQHGSGIFLRLGYYL